MAVANLTSKLLVEVNTNFMSVSVKGVKLNSNSSVATLLQWKALLPLDISILLSFLFLISGILCNTFLGLYVGEKLKKRSGVRILLCNQIFANLVALFSYMFVPLHVLDREPTWNLERLCKVIPSLGFHSVSTSLTNLAAIYVSYYYGKRHGKFAICSTVAALLVVVGSWSIGAAITTPMAMSLATLEVKINETAATMCVGVWSDETYRDVYMNCVFILKFAVPALVISCTCLKMELCSLISGKTQRCRKISAVLIDVLAGACLLLLIYFFPLSSVGKGKFLGPSPGITDTINIVRLCELIALANCASIPLVLAAFVDEFRKNEQNSDCSRKPSAYLLDTKDEEKSSLDYPSNASCVTYDVLTADMPEKWRPSPSRVLIV